MGKPSFVFSVLFLIVLLYTVHLIVNQKLQAKESVEPIKVYDCVAAYLAVEGSYGRLCRIYDPLTNSHYISATVGALISIARAD